VTSYLTQEQIDRLLAPVNPARVETLPGKSLSYLAQHDVRAHMNRIFGFARWSTNVVQTEFLWEEKNEQGRWNACYRATVRVEVCSPDGQPLAHYEDAHVSGNAPQPDRAEAHALALTSAVSTAFKRACTNLGDQFGLSLYEKGQRTALVKGTLVHAAIQESLDKTADDADVVPGTTDGPSDEAMAVLDEFLALAAQGLDPGDRILAVAGLKTKHDHLLTALVPVGDSTLTLGTVADRVAAGKDFS